jgi:hypothetical protein
MLQEPTGVFQLLRGQDEVQPIPEISVDKNDLKRVSIGSFLKDDP